MTELPEFIFEHEQCMGGGQNMVDVGEGMKARLGTACVLYMSLAPT